MTLVRSRIAVAVCSAMLAGFALTACGSSSVADQVPKSTPELTPPTDTSAEKAAVQTTSTSTTAKTKTSTSETAEAESSSETTPSETGEASEASPSGGTGAEEKPVEKGSESEEATGASSPTGGASAP